MKKVIRPCKVVGNDCVIPLTQGKTSVVDVADFGVVSNFNWQAVKDKCGRFFVSRKFSYNGTQYAIKLHRQLLDAALRNVGHIDRDGLNNRRSNLRLCTTAECQRYRKGSYGSSSFKGVYRGHDYVRWRAHIIVSGTDISLGLFKLEADAARAYDIAATELFGEFARLNFPCEMVPSSEHGALLSDDDTCDITKAVRWVVYQEKYGL